MCREEVGFGILCQGLLVLLKAHQDSGGDFGEPLWLLRGLFWIWVPGCCNVARIEAEREAGIHFRPGYEYGPGPDDLHYSLYGPDGVPFYNYLGPEDAIPEPLFPSTAGRPGDHIPLPEPPLQPSELQPHYVASHPGLCCCKNVYRY